MSDWDDEESWDDTPSEPRTTMKKSVTFVAENRRPRGGLGRGRAQFGPRTSAEDTNSRDTRKFRQSGGNKKVLIIPRDKVGLIIGKGGSNVRDIEYQSGTNIKISQTQGDVSEVAVHGTDDAIIKAEQLIMECTQERNPQMGKQMEKRPQKRMQRSGIAAGTSAAEPAPLPKELFTIDSAGNETIDFQKLNLYHEEQNKIRFSKLAPIIKDFYVEDPEIAAMSPDEVEQWRKNNFDIQVKHTFFGTENEKIKCSDLPQIPNPVLTFEQAFHPYPEILKLIQDQGFTQPSPIQSQAWPILLKGNDMIGIAQTGTGKTLAFLLPALIHIEGQAIPKEKRTGPTVLVLVPTRELAIQIYREVLKFPYKDISSICVYGGADRTTQIEGIAAGVDIVVATPGRLADLIVNNYLRAIDFSYVVFDEADKMLDMGFEADIRKSLFDVRPDRQTVLTSATWPNIVKDLAKTYTRTPIQVNVGSLDLSAVHTVTQKLLFIDETDKDDALMDFINSMGPTDKVIVFCGKRATASDIGSNLAVMGINNQCLYGTKDQYDREEALSQIQDGTVNILIATDLASRGIDIKDLTHVVNLDFPKYIEEYVHRIGRTGRAGKTGTALSFMTKHDSRHAKELIRILEEANQEVPAELRTMAVSHESYKARAKNRGGFSRGRGRGKYNDNYNQWL